MHHSVVSAVVDFRTLWQNISPVALGYLLLLIAFAVHVCIKCARSLLNRRDLSEGHIQGEQYSLHRSLFGMFLLFAVVLSNEVFGALKGTALSTVSLSEVPLYKTLEGPTALAFFVSSVLFVLHSVSRVAFKISATRLKREGEI